VVTGIDRFVAKFRVGWKGNDPNTKLCEAILIRPVLCNCLGNVNRLARVK
jgi:hypothetical protein